MIKQNQQNVVKVEINLEILQIKKVKEKVKQVKRKENLVDYMF